MFYLAHISDIHLTPMPAIAKKQILNKRFLGYLNLYFNRKNLFSREYLDQVINSIAQHQPDYLAISGDLVNLATKQEFKNTQNWLNLIAKKNNIAICFGNHDAYVRGSFDYACKIFNEWLKTDININSFQYFPNVQIKDNVAIINVSSAMATPPFFALGYFDYKQACKLEELLDICKQKNLFRVINIHHPPFKNATAWYKKLWGLNNFTQAVKNKGAELIIHGHTHKSTINYMFNIPIIGIGSASIACLNNAAYNIFAITQLKNKWNCILTSYGINERGNIVKKASIKL